MKSRGFLTDSDQKRLTCALQNMRMSCNSTYLLDHETDFGVKTDEIVILLSEWLERPEAKAVVLSQWVRSHELLAGRLKIRTKRGLGIRKRGDPFTVIPRSSFQCGTAIAWNFIRMSVKVPESRMNWVMSLNFPPPFVVRDGMENRVALSRLEVDRDSQ